MLTEAAGAATGGEEAEEAPASAELPRDAALAALSFVTEGVLLVKSTDPAGAPAQERLQFVAVEIEAASA